MSSAKGKGKGKASPAQSTLGTDGDDWKLGKKPATPNARGTTMTLRKSHTAMMERSPTVFPNAKMSTFKDAPSAEKRKILDEADKVSKDERAKMRGGGVAPPPTWNRVRSTRRLSHTMARSAPTRRRSAARRARRSRWPTTRPSSCRLRHRPSPTTLRELNTATDERGEAERRPRRMLREREPRL